MMKRPTPTSERTFVYVRKADGQIVEWFPTCFDGWAVAWDILTEVSFSDDSPILFDDDEKFKPTDYVYVGEL